MKRRTGELLCLLAIAALLLAACGSSSNEKPAANKTFTRSNYAQLVSNPDDYKGARVRIVGKVFSVERDEKGTYLQVWADPANSEWNTIVTVSDPKLAVAEDDYVKIVGTVTGKFEGENMLGGKVTVPTVIADKVIKTTALAAASPAKVTLPRQTWSRHGLTITISKVEFASDETRVFVDVHNESDAAFSLYSSSIKAISGGQQSDSTFSFADYPELSSDVQPGASSSGVTVFPKLDPALPLELVCEGYSEDSDIGEYGSLKVNFEWSGRP